MSAFRTVTDDFSVAPQIAVADLARAAAEGFVRVINNRPDGEEPGQPASAEFEAEARRLGLDYLHVPVRGAPGPAEVDAVRQAVAEADGKVLAFCRSGTRSIVTWSVGQALSGERSRSELSALGRAAGYDLSGVLGA